MTIHSALTHLVTKRVLSTFFSKRQKTLKRSDHSIARQKNAEIILATAPKNLYFQLNLLTMLGFIILWLCELFGSFHLLSVIDSPDPFKLYVVFAVLIGGIGPTILLTQYLTIWTFSALGGTISRDALLLKGGHINQGYYASEIEEKNRIVFDDNYEKNHRFAQIASFGLLLSAFLPLMYFALMM